MTPLTSKERIARTLQREPIDRIGAMESFWTDTQAHWAAQGHLADGETVADHFGLDMRTAGWPTLVADLDRAQEVIEEDDQTKLVRNGNGAVLRWWKNKSGTPEHVDFEVKDRASWNELVRPFLVDDDLIRRRIPFEAYRSARAQCDTEQLYFCWSGVNVFECMHPVCGHEYMLMGMALDPGWVLDMCEVFTDLLIKCQQILFAEEGKPDGIWYYEDMGFKHKPFMSPAMYKQIIWPSHKRTFDYAHSIGCPVIVHSCGYVEQLVPDLIEAGMDCLQALEVKAGMDLLALKAKYGDQIALCGGLDIRALETNDTAQVDALLQANLPGAIANGGYILHTDHSVSSRVEYKTYKHFIDRGREIGTY